MTKLNKSEENQDRKMKDKKIRRLGVLEKYRQNKEKKSK